jgi:lysophospholipid acyltransferase (LPLAT)-like uncharacterized protein
MAEQSDWIKKAAGQAAAVAWPLVAKLHDYRVATYDDSVDPAEPNHSGKCLFVFWHEFLGILVPKWGNCPVTILVSQHRDGEWMSQIAEALGFKTARGSSTRGGSSAIRQLKALSRTQSIGITPDGPQGPRRQMSQGPVYLASKLQIPIICIGIGAHHPWRLNTWDQFVVPKPFRRVRVLFGPKIYVPPKVDREQLTHYQDALQTSLEVITKVAQDWADGVRNHQGYRPYVRRRAA